MKFTELLNPDCTSCALEAASKKRALELAGELLARTYPEFDAEAVFDALMARERLGSTAVGEGVAIPHCRLESCERPVGALMQLASGVDFDAPDGAPVDLLFILVVPAEAHEDHLQLLASAAGAFNEPRYRDALRRAQDARDLFDAAHYDPPNRGAAAG